jgi:hypothetical protein
MNCIICNKPLRKTKRIDFINRCEHFSCIEKLRKKKYEEELKELIDLISEGLKRIELDFGCNILIIKERI